MRNKLFVSMTALVLLALPLAAQAQGTAAARKKVPKKAVVPLVLSVLL